MSTTYQPGDRVTWALLPLVAFEVLPDTKARWSDHYPIREVGRPYGIQFVVAEAELTPAVATSV